MTELQLTENKEIKAPVTKLNVKEVLLKTVRIYKAGFKPFLILSILGYFITICTTASEIIRPYSTGWSLFASALVLAFIYITIKSNVGIYKLTSSLLQGEILTAKESLRSANGLCGTYFGISLLYGLILVLPTIAVALSYTLIENLYLKWGMVVLFGIPLVFLIVRYSFALAFGLLSNSSSGEFNKSKLLIVGEFWRVLVVILITVGISILIPSGLTVLIGLNNPTMTGLILAAFVDAILSIILAPISNIATVVMYYSLIKNKGWDNPETAAEALPAEKETITMQYERVEQPKDDSTI